VTAELSPRRGTAASGPTPEGPRSDDRSWEARPVLSRAIRVGVVLVPISVGALAAIQANRVIPIATGVVGAVARSLLVVAISTFTVWAVDRWARKLLPLAALMQLSLVFPDQAPSRFRTALKSGSSRRLERTLQETRTRGLSRDPGDAARQVVELIGAIGDHDRRTRGHSERVRLYADLVGEELKLTKEERQKLQWGALLHDLGKLMVPGEILNKAGKPDAEEWRVLQSHPEEGMRLIEPLRPFLGEWVHAIGGHHEKWDGSGYPRGLAGTQIPRAGAIVAVADSFEVMTALRSYKKPMSLQDARAELTRCAGTHFSPDVVRAFLQISLGHLRIVSGPLAALAHVPFLGNLAQLPAAASAAVPTFAGAAVPAAAMVTAAALSVGTPPPAEAFEQVLAAEASTTTLGASAPDATDRGPDAVGEDAADTPATTSTVVESAGASEGLEQVGAAPSSGSGEGTTSTTLATTTTEPAARPTTTTTTSASPTTAAPASTIPSTVPAPPAAPSTSVSPPTTVASSYAVYYATNPLRLPASNLNGASITRGTRIYVYAPVGSVDRVDFTYPGGSRRAETFPYDMMGGGVTANSWTVPSTPGTYTITASPGGGSGSAPAPLTVTFVVT